MELNITHPDKGHRYVHTDAVYKYIYICVCIHIYNVYMCINIYIYNESLSEYRLCCSLEGSHSKSDAVGSVHSIWKEQQSDREYLTPQPR